MTSQEFKDTVLPCYRSMYALAFSITRSPSDAADAVQDTVTHLWERRQTLSTVTDIRAYCLTSVRNRVCSSMRSAHPTCNIDEITVSAPPSSAPEAIGHLDLSDSRRRLAAALASLPARQRMVFALSAFSGHTNKEISVLTGLTEVNIRAILSRSRQFLRKALSDN